MSLIPEADGLQDAIQFILKQLLDATAAVKASPRGIPTTELLGAAIKITNPRNRLVIRPARRRWSVPFAMGEYLWYMRGENSLAAVEFYAAGLRRFSDDGLTLHSAYGHRIFGLHPQVRYDQWRAAKNLLLSDPHTRQAIIQIRTPDDTLIATRDHPCTIALQFIQRFNKLHMITTMRSNDIILGTSYDIFAFTMMQEQMALELGLEIGEYYHQVGSWHLYDRDAVLAEEMVSLRRYPTSMPPVEAGLEQMIADEERIRHGEVVEAGDGYWRDWRIVLSTFAGTAKGPPSLSHSYRYAWQMSRQHRSRHAHNSAEGL